MATYKPSTRRSIDKPEEIALHPVTTGNSRDEEKAHLPAVVSEDVSEQFERPAETAQDLVTEVIHVHDDPLLNPWTFRMWFLGKSYSILLYTLNWVSNANDI
jgi:hypothetical protein